MTVATPARPRSILLATLVAAAGFAFLIGLGVWQIERKAWKENLIDMLAARLAAAPQSLPPRQDWPTLDQAQDEFRRVSLRGEFAPGETALVYAAPSAFRPDVSGPGYWVLAPARLRDGGTLVVNRGFIPAERKDAVPTAPAGAVDIVGVLRWPEPIGMFTPAPDVAHGIWYSRDPAAIAAAKKWGAVAPFSLEQEAPQLPGAPQVGRLVVQLPDNHLQYAITWFGLAAALAGVYAVWLFGLRRRG
jgi:surfeit locus 1 family protein